MDAQDGRHAHLARMRIDLVIHTPLDAGGCGFSADRIAAACKRPDNSHQVTWDDLLIEICTKTAGDRTDVLGIGLNNDPWHLMFAFQVHPDLDERPLEDLAPLQIVESLAERFGLPITIGGDTAKFFLTQELAVPPDAGEELPKADVVKIENPQDHPCILVCAAARKDPIIRVAMAFCIDHPRYREWIGDRY